MFSSFQSTTTTVSGAAAAGGISLGTKDNTNAGLSGQSYNVDAWKLAFQSNGTVLVSSCKFYTSVVNQNTKVWADYDGTNPPVCGTAVSKTVPTNGAIYSAVDVLVSGVVKGRVTVASSGDIIFAGNTTYNANGVDVLGLEAQGTLYVAQYAMAATVNLWAAELSLSGPFEADPLYNSGASGTMNFNGSTAVYGGGSGAVIFTNMFSTRNYNYDPNLSSSSRRTGRRSETRSRSSSSARSRPRERRRVAYATTESASPSRSAILRTRASWCPTPSATWWVGPSAHQASKKAAGPDGKRILEFVFPILKVGPAIDSPSAAISFSRPSAVCVTPRIVTGPRRTFISIESPAPALPWKSLSARATGRPSAIARWPGPSCPIRTNSSSKSSA